MKKKCDDVIGACRFDGFWEGLLRVADDRCFELVCEIICDVV